MLLAIPEISKIKATNKSNVHVKTFPPHQNDSVLPSKLVGWFELVLKNFFSKNKSIKSVLKNITQTKTINIMNGRNLETRTNVNIKPPIRPPTDSRIYTIPISAAESRVTPRITLHAIGNIRPMVKLNGTIINVDEINNDRMGIYCPVGIKRIYLNTLIKSMSSGSIKHIDISIKVKADKWFLNLLIILTPIAAPDATPKSQAPRIIPMQSSFPKKTTRNSRIKSTWAIVAWHPIKNIKNNINTHILFSRIMYFPYCKITF